MTTVQKSRARRERKKKIHRDILYNFFQCHCKLHWPSIVKLHFNRAAAKLRLFFHSQSNRHSKKLLARAQSVPCGVCCRLYQPSLTRAQPNVVSNISLWARGPICAIYFVLNVYIMHRDDDAAVLLLASAKKHHTKQMTSASLHFIFQLYTVLCCCFVHNFSMHIFVVVVAHSLAAHSCVLGRGALSLREEEEEKLCIITRRTKVEP